MKKIPLTRNKFAIVDNDDFSRLNEVKWFFNGAYAVRNTSQRLGKRKKGFEIDHINGDKLDNRQKNLRTVNGFQNKANRGKTKANTSGFKGVFWEKKSKRWYSKIVVKNKYIYVGCFLKPEDAFKAYCEASVKYNGKFSRYYK